MFELRRLLPFGESRNLTENILAVIGNPKVMLKFADFCPETVCVHACKDLKDNVKLLIFLN